MDLLSRLLDLTPVTGRIDVRCHFGAPWRLDRPAAETLDIQYHVLLSGEAQVDDEDGNAAMQAGDIVLFPAGGAHAIHDGSGRKPRPLRAHVSEILTVAGNTGKGAAADLLCGHFVLPAASQRLVREFLPRRLIVRSQSAGDTDQRLARLIGLMRDEALEEGPGSASLIGHLSAALFALALRSATRDTASRSQQELQGTDQGLLALASKPRLQPAVLAMFDRPGQPWTLPQLADLCHMSRATFVRQFQAATGHSPSELLTEIRMSQALRQLAETGLAVASIGEAAGYQSEAAFQRAFKRHAGVTPARWRTAQRLRP